MSTPEREVVRAAWMEKVASVRDVLIEHAEESEANGTLAQPAVDALRDAGFFMLKMPAALGGAEADPMLQIEVIEALSYIDAASGWCAMIAAGSGSGMSAFLPEAGAELVYGRGAPITAGSFFPAGRAVPVTGGYRVSGRYRFASGIRHSDWISCSAVVVRHDGQMDADNSSAEVVNIVVPTSEVEIHDNWHVVGLRGTGSCDFSIDDLFVPTELTFAPPGTTPKPNRGGPLFHLTIPASVATEHIGFAAGVARRALDELTIMATTQRGRYRPSALSERQVVHRKIGEFDLRLRAARAWPRFLRRYLASTQPGRACPSGGSGREPGDRDLHHRYCG
ncbi:MAG: hypothetical protein HC802_23225 [Caldilineaceae bacterium]|nr:hypothetical protein [Caldilineaceae bacterium]